MTGCWTWLKRKRKAASCCLRWSMIMMSRTACRSPGRSPFPRHRRRHHAMLTVSPPMICFLPKRLCLEPYALDILIVLLVFVIIILVLVVVHHAGVIVPPYLLQAQRVRQQVDEVACVVSWRVRERVWCGVMIGCASEWERCDYVVRVMRGGSIPNWSSSSFPCTAPASSKRSSRSSSPRSPSAIRSCK